MIKIIVLTSCPAVYCTTSNITMNSHYMLETPKATRTNVI